MIIYIKKIKYIRLNNKWLRINNDHLQSFNSALKFTV